MATLIFTVLSLVTPVFAFFAAFVAVALASVIASRCEAPIEVSYSDTAEWVETLESELAIDAEWVSICEVAAIVDALGVAAQMALVADIKRDLASVVAVIRSRVQCHTSYPTIDCEGAPYRTLNLTSCFARPTFAAQVDALTSDFRDAFSIDAIDAAWDDAPPTLRCPVRAA